MPQLRLQGQSLLQLLHRFIRHQLEVISKSPGKVGQPTEQEDRLEIEIATEMKTIFEVGKYFDEKQDR